MTTTRSNDERDGQPLLPRGVLPLAGESGSCSEPSATVHLWALDDERSPQKRLVRAISAHLSPQKSRLHPLLSGSMDWQDREGSGDDDSGSGAERDALLEAVRHWDTVVPIQRLGQGTSGCVYRASWKGVPVAVKYIPCRSGDEQALQAAAREVVLAKHFTHPHVVQCYSWAVLTPRHFEATDVDLAGAKGLGGDGADWRGTGEGPPVDTATDNGRERGAVDNRGTGGAAAAPAPALARDWVIKATYAPGDASRGDDVHRRNPAAASSPAGSSDSDTGFGSPIKHKLSMEACSSAKCSVLELEGLHLDPNDTVLAVLMELCDLGSLAKALRRRVFLPSERWQPHLTTRALLRTAQEVAKGMAYIHEHGVVHGDLKPANVLLTTHRADRRGYIAKVADFGLSRGIGLDDGGDPHPGGSGRRPQGLATAAYAGPELIAGGTPTPASDVYAFGIILWEMTHCRPVYAGFQEHSVLAGVLDGSLRPQFDPGCLPALRALAYDCWAQDPELRPSFQSALERLVAAEVELRGQHLAAGTLSSDLGDRCKRQAPLAAVRRQLMLEVGVDAG